MTIPQEIQDLMPEKAECVKECAYAEYGEAMECTCGAVERNKTITEVEAVLPQMLALERKRGAEEERERWINGNVCHSCGKDLEDEAGLSSTCLKCFEEM